MEYTGVAQLLENISPFCNLSGLSFFTVRINSILVGGGGKPIPIVTGRIYDDLALWSTTLGDDSLKLYVNCGFVNRNFGTFVDNAVEELPENPDDVKVSVLRQKLSKTGLIDRDVCFEYVIASGIDPGDRERVIEILDMSDIHIFNLNRPLKKSEVSKAAKIVAGNLGANLGFFDTLDRRSMLVYCLYIVELCNRHPKNLDVIRGSCDALERSSSQVLVMELLREFNMNDPLHIECASEVGFAICMIEEAYGSSVTVLTTDPIVLAKVDYLMKHA